MAVQLKHYFLNIIQYSSFLRLIYYLDTWQVNKILNVENLVTIETVVYSNSLFLC